VRWETCPNCGEDAVTVHVRDEREVGGTRNLMVSVAREGTGRQSLMPAVSLRCELIWLKCLGCGHRWRG
jgi:hypothetical protein